MRRLNYVFIALLFLSGCYPEWTPDHPSEAEGYIPVYGTSENVKIALLAPRQVKEPGKIYVYGKYLLVNEIRLGIHVFDNTDPATPIPLGFIEILGNTDMAIRNDVLYADHMGNIVAVAIADFPAVETRATLPLYNWEKDSGVPPPTGYYFECLDRAKGIVLGWKKSTLKNPTCYAIQ